MQPNNVSHQTGFTLVELVVGIVLMAIALTFITNVFFSNPGRSVEPLLQIRAAEYGQALMDEILSKKFDETTPLGSVPACTTCTNPSPASWWDDGESRDTFDDVDDYNSYCATSAPYYDLEDYSGNTMDGFENYSMSVCVVYDADYDGSDDGAVGNAKLITIDIYPPASVGSGITFTAYKGNY